MTIRGKPTASRWPATTIRHNPLIQEFGTVAGGIGTEIALTLVANGATDLFLADLNLEGVQVTKDKCTAPRDDNNGPNVRVHVSKLDITDEADVQRVVNAAYDKLGRIDHFVNAAGVSRLQ